jgi:hypothetical protein
MKLTTASGIQFPFKLSGAALALPPVGTAVAAAVVAVLAVLAGLAASALLLALTCTDNARIDSVGAAAAWSVARQERMVDVVVIVESTTLWM